MRFVVATIMLAFMLFISVVSLVTYGLVTDNLKPAIDSAAEDQDIGGKYHGVMDTLWIVGWIVCLLSGPVASVVLYLVAAHWQEAEQYETYNTNRPY